MGVDVRSDHHLWLGYLAAYPGLGSSAGKLGWTQKGEYEAEVAKANKELEPLYARFASMTLKAIAVDTQAKAIGERLFMNNCAQCHGSDARGSKGFPTWPMATGCTVARTTRSWKPCKGPHWQHASHGCCRGSPEDVRNLSHYVLSLSGSPTILCVLLWASPSLVLAPPATAWTARAIRLWVRPT